MENMCDLTLRVASFEISKFLDLCFQWTLMLCMCNLQGHNVALCVACETKSELKGLELSLEIACLV